MGKVRQIIDSESEKAFQEQKESFAKLESKLNEKVSYYQNEYMKKLEAITQMFEVEKKKLKDEHKIKHDQLENYSEFVQKKNQQIRNHFNEIINRDKALDEKEKKLFKLQKELEQREKRIKEEEKLSPTKAHEKIIDIQQLDNKVSPQQIILNTHTKQTQIIP